MAPEPANSTLTERPRGPIGRDAIIAEVRASIGRVRGLSLVGPGGIGKTTIAAAVAGDVSAVPDGPWQLAWIDLTAVTSVPGMAARVAAVLRVAESRDELLDTAIDGSLARRQTLLVLDNAEEVVDAGPWVAHRLQASGSLAVLATSRRRLGYAGEVVRQVRGLASPERASPEAIRSSPAGQLLLERAAAAGRRLSVEGDAAADVLALLDRLEGMPLAIELAARRTRILTPRSVLERLRSGEVLSDRTRAMPRHASLHAALRWSLDALTPPQADLLGLLSAWIGRFEIDVVEALAPRSGVLDDLDALVDVGLVQVLDDAPDSIRFRVLETVRDALDPDIRVAAQRHAAHWLAGRLDAWAEALSGRVPEGQAWFERARPTVEALVDELGPGDRSGAALAVAAAPYWIHAGALRQPLDVCRAAMASEDEDTVVRACLAVSAIETVLRGGRSGAEPARVALVRSRAHHSPGLELAALFRLGASAVQAGDTDAGRLLRRALALANRLRRPGDAVVLRHRLADLGQPSAEVVPALESLLETARGSAEPDVLAAILNDLAANELFLGHDARAVTYADEAAGLYRDQGAPPRAAWATLLGAAAAAGAGRLALARRLLLEAGATVADGGPAIHVFFLINALPLLSRTDLGGLAARAVGARDAHFAETGQNNTPDEDAWWQREVEAARRRTSPLVWHLEAQAGAETPPGTVVAEVLSSIGGRPHRPVRDAPMLTRREVEVLGLVGRGLSDAQIAAVLFISPKTASVHVSNIKAKLEVDSRLAAALKAQELGLVARAG